MAPAGLACFDFDWSLIETDSDRFVIEYLSPALRKKLDERAMQWTDLQNECLKEFHEQGGSSQLVRESLTKVPMDSDMIKTCHLLYERGWDLAIVSDANSVYIESILEHYGIRHLFSAIVTNPAFWDAEGRLHIHRLTPADVPHGCPLGVCSLNICKGQEVDKLVQQRLGPNSANGSTLKMLYVGDGQNDYCPALRMKNPEDLYFVRKGRSLEKYLEKNSAAKDALPSRIVYWSSASDILKTIQ
ncbi:hypothetical protein EMPS_11154 [Entomortierella parvispora]|uniref:Phosphatase n=1 Tax=Entomortierella parvispora TaxID=205924 RepID=A0A9P3HL63_9FUNG|nr:hypothetical protein EMPS_11154 [Entomortierella parvispora]